MSEISLTYPDCIWAQTVVGQHVFLAYEISNFVQVVANTSHKMGTHQVFIFICLIAAGSSTSTTTAYTTTDYSTQTASTTDEITTGTSQSTVIFTTESTPSTESSVALDTSGVSPAATSAWGASSTDSASSGSTEDQCHTCKSVQNYCTANFDEFINYVSTIPILCFIKKQAGITDYTLSTPISTFSMHFV